MEGLRLKAAGFIYHATYATTIKNKKIILALDPDGLKAVSGRKRKGQEEFTPIIDLGNAEITALLAGANEVKISYSASKITIQKA